MLWYISSYSNGQLKLAISYWNTEVHVGHSPTQTNSDSPSVWTLSWRFVSQLTTLGLHSPPRLPDRQTYTGCSWNRGRVSELESAFLTFRQLQVSSDIEVIVLKPLCRHWMDNQTQQVSSTLISRQTDCSSTYVPISPSKRTDKAPPSGCRIKRDLSLSASHMRNFNCTLSASNVCVCVCAYRFSELGANKVVMLLSFPAVDLLEHKQKIGI